MNITVRKFDAGDIQRKVDWINDSDNNKYLHYDLPLEYQKTLDWFEKIKDRTDRYDAVIEADGVPCGLIGLLSIDRKNRKAEFYICMGEAAYKGKGVARQASRLILDHAFNNLGLNRVYLYTEVDNKAAQRLFEKVGFVKEGVIRSDLLVNGRYVDRIIYGICKEVNKRKNKEPTPVQRLDLPENNNHIYIKRDDLVPVSFGGNKARKALLFFEEIDKGSYDCVVTYGSSRSNHCRVVANLAAARGMKCCIISPSEASEESSNSMLVKLLGAEYITCPVDEVQNTIERKMDELKALGHRPYFIPGGGHGVIGTQAYVDCYEEIMDFEARSGIRFDYIFHASGTGTTQAGLVCGKLLNKGKEKIIGISIARKNPRGRQVVVDSAHEYLKSVSYRGTEGIEEEVCFIDDYTADGYGKSSGSIREIIRHIWMKFGIPMDSTYTAKAFAGMQDYIKKNDISGKNILFIHTGETPLFFDDLCDL